MKPKIRFKGFEGEWKKVKASSIFKTFNEKNRPDLPVLSATQDRGMVTRDSIGYKIDHDKTNEATYKHILPGQFVIHLRSFQGGFAHSEIEGIASPAYTIMEFKNKELYHDFYWRYVFMSKKFIKSLEYITYGIRDGRSISYDDFKETSFIVPSQKEQIKIAEYNKDLDSQISASTSRLASLKQMKAASLQAMFPQEGETVPKVRFKGFEGEWKKVKFSELYERSSIKNDLSFGADKIISVANMYYTNNEKLVDNDYLRSYNVMRLGDIAFEGHSSKDFAYGRFVENTIGDGIVSHVFVVMKPISMKYDLYFWKYYINNENIMGNILCRCTKASTMMNDIVINDFLKESILVPSYEEQVEIGKILTSLDHQITLQTQRLEKLKQIKSACLDKMFV